MNLFMSYAREDKEHMEGLEKSFSKSVRDKKISLWIDKNEITSSSFLDHKIADAIEKSNIALLLLSSNFWFSDYIQDEELKFILEENKKRGLLIYPIILRDVKDFFRYKDTFQNEITASPFNEEGNLTPIEDFISINSKPTPFKAYNKIAEDIEKISETLFHNPYKHLSYFETKDSDSFYGREKISNELAINISNIKMALLTGESGVGKTSLILAGVFPLLNINRNFKLIYIYSRGNLLSIFKDTIIKELDGSQDLEIKDIVINFLKFRQKKLLFVFDQFEQIFLDVSSKDRESFFNIIYQIKEEVPNVHMIFSLREDYFVKLEIYRDRFQELWNNSTFLYRLEKEEVLNAIIKPLEKDSISFELANRIYEDLLKTNIDGNAKAFTPLLQLVLFELYTKALSQNSIKITEKIYNESGGVYKVLENYFDNVFKQFNKQEFKILVEFFSLLTSSISTKSSVLKDELNNIFGEKYQKEIYRLIDILIKNRVIRYTKVNLSADIEEYYEFTHDILIELIRDKFTTIVTQDEPPMKQVKRAFNTPQKRFPFSEKKYKAFLAYSHNDEAFGKWLHQELEKYKIPQRLYDNYPTLPKTLYPIFRERSELNAGDDLGVEISKALENSEALIVVCSISSANSKWINKEIIDFKMMHGEDRIFPIIVDGEPFARESDKFDDSLECFPEALKYKVDSEGNLTDEQTSILASSTIEKEGGRKLAKLKLIAGVLDVPFGEFYRRVEMENLKKNRLRLSLIFVIIMLVISIFFSIFERNKAIDCRERANKMEYEVTQTLKEQNEPLPILLNKKPPLQR